MRMAMTLDMRCAIRAPHNGHIEVVTLRDRVYVDGVDKAEDRLRLL